MSYYQLQNYYNNMYRIILSRITDNNLEKMYNIIESLKQHQKYKLYSTNNQEYDIYTETFYFANKKQQCIFSICISFEPKQYITFKWNSKFIKQELINQIIELFTNI